ncbi:hypothetical protein QZH41_012353 [Actinostola sp. cb2023]|nr:hypothetical protein QZH41_012353 [Actinostola sp. cb2023]
MTKVMELYWIPRLRRLVRKVVKGCAGCKRFQAVACGEPPSAPLPKDRTEGSTPFEVIGVDYAGPLTYKISKKKEARRGRPRKVYSDNGRTFVGAAKWIRAVMNDEMFHSILAQNNIIWQFNLSRAPWWGGQFERLIGLVKRALQKSIGRGLLSWDELSEVLLDVEAALNSRPLSYVEDDHQLPVLKPNALLYTQSNVIPELEIHHVED